LTVDTEGGQLRDFSVTNLLGQQVLSGKTTQQIDVSSLAKGTYMGEVGSEVAKFVKQ
jgi:Secretion system C-terminal sorting domain